MSRLTITSKGQVTLRRDILDHLGVVPGQKIIVDKLPDGAVQVRAAPTGRIEDVFGLLKPKKGLKISVDDMNEIAARSWAGER
ncbi:MAG: AbrB/MazE/SpoVT family DNA-binding domain-containing protein [Parvularculaceae bacterium]